MFVQSVKSNIDQVVREFKGMDKKIVNKAVVTALNKMGKELKTLAKKEIVSTTGLKAGTVGRRITMKKATWNRPAVVINIKGRHFNLIESGAREVKGGISHKAWGQRTRTRGGFIMDGASGNRIVVKRLRGQKTSTGKDRLKGMYGASASVEYFRGGVDETLKARVAHKFPKLLRTAMDFQFRKALKKDKLLGRFVK
jgi:hypothetical protein